MSLQPQKPVSVSRAKGGVQPKYAQLKDSLRQRILDGSYAPHSQLPSESELGLHHGVSRITVRQALAELENENLIFKVHGKGSFVSKPRAAQDITHLEGFGEAMARQGFEIFNKVVGLRTLKATPLQAERLQLPTGAQVVELKRLRHLNREPVSLDVSCFPQEIGERLRRADLQHADLFALIENQLALPLGRAQVNIEAILCGEAVSRALKVAPGSALLRVERLIHTVAGRPVVHEHLCVRSDAMQYRMQVERRHLAD